MKNMKDLQNEIKDGIDEFSEERAEEIFDNQSLQSDISIPGHSGQPENVSEEIIERTEATLKESNEGRELQEIGKTTEEKLVLFLRSRCNSPATNEGEQWHTKGYANNPKIIPIGCSSFGTREYNEGARIDTLSYEDGMNYYDIDILDVSTLCWFRYGSVSGSTLEFIRNEEGGFDVSGKNLGVNTGLDVENMTGRELDPSFMNLTGQLSYITSESLASDNEEDRKKFEEFLSRVQKKELIDQELRATQREREEQEEDIEKALQKMERYSETW